MIRRCSCGRRWLFIFESVRRLIDAVAEGNVMARKRGGGEVRERVGALVWRSLGASPRTTSVVSFSTYVA